MTLIPHYSELIKALPDGPLTRQDLLIADLLVAKEKQLEIYYAPYDYVNQDAKIIIAGITPGFTQMALSLQQARMDLIAGIPSGEIDRRAKIIATFAGPMRINLIQMLDELRLNELLNIPTTKLLFDDLRSLIHTTSVIRYPTFNNGRNYSGHSPQILSSSLLKDYVIRGFANELKQIGEAVIIPLGKSVSDVLRWLQTEGLDLQDRCLLDFPHPSGANGHRHKQFDSLKERHRALLWNAREQFK